MISLTRLLEIHKLLDDMNSASRVHYRAAAKLAGIGNMKGHNFFLSKALKEEHIAIRCFKRLEQDAD